MTNSSGERVGLDEYKAKCAQEDCKAFLNGNCRFPPGKCWRRHPKNIKKAYLAKEKAKPSGEVDQKWFKAVHSKKPSMIGRAFMLRDSDYMDDEAFRRYLQQAEEELNRHEEHSTQAHQLQGMTNAMEDVDEASSSDEVRRPGELSPPSSGQDCEGLASSRYWRSMIGRSPRYELVGPNWDLIGT